MAIFINIKLTLIWVHVGEWESDIIITMNILPPETFSSVNALNFHCTDWSRMHCKRKKCCDIDEKTTRFR